MALLRASSIQRKLTLLVMLTTSVALLSAAVQFVINDARDYRRRVVADLAILAQIIGQNVTSSLKFDDAKEAAITLNSLRAKPQVLTAAAYNKSGKLFAHYPPTEAAAEALPSVPPELGQRFGHRRVVLSQAIVDNGDRLGTIYFEVDLSEVWRRVVGNCAVTLAMLVIAALIAYFIASRLQRAISKPILDLAKVATVISQKRDYSVRALKETEDEVGFLIDCFNGMLAEMQKHERALREVNEQLAKSETRALAATEAKTQFLANMSHELRTPLNAIIGYSEMLLEEVQDAGQPQYVSDLEKIHAAARHQLGLINDILDVSKIEAGKMTLFLETFDVGRAVAEVAATVRPLVGKNSNQLEVQCPADIGAMRADQTKVRQVLFNLLSNAAKFTERGKIRLEVQRESEVISNQSSVIGGADAGVQLATRVTDRSSAITFRVSDTGIGMTPEQMGRLFQAFSQAEASTTRKYGGTGLGLAISKKFCEMMGGDLTVSSQSGQGSTFTARLPAQVQEAQSPARAISATGGPAPVPPDSAILVIDDEPAARDLVQRALTKEGFRVQTASSGPEGLLLARQMRPAAITLDVMMPGMDGWAVLTVLKADPLTANIPVIMVTVVDDKNLGFALGAAEYLIKPIEWDRLIAVLQRYQRHASGSHVLVIEDDPEARQMFRRAAEKHGWQVVEAENGRAGLERVAAALPGVILLDLMMPEMDGFSFIEELRRRPDGRQIPVIVVTAKDLTVEDRRRLNGHVIQILQKGGYSTRQLVDEINKVLGNMAELGKDI